MKKWILHLLGYLIALGFIVLLIGPLVGVKVAQFAALKAQGEAMEAPVESVSEALVERMQWDVSLMGIGTLSSPQGAMLESELAGVVEKIHFDNGQLVEAGQLLIELESSVEQAELESAKASVELAEIEFTRAEKLVASQAAPQSQLDRSRVELRQARAVVATLEAILQKKTLRAPFAGTVGLRAVNEGQLVSPGTPLVSLQNLATLEVRFDLPQGDLRSIAVGMQLEIRPEAKGGPTYAGSLVAIDPAVDARSRSLHLLGRIPNGEGALRPGMFVRVRLILDQAREVLAIPNTAVLAAAYGNSVFTLLEDEETGHFIARQQFVRTGERRGDFVEIVEGLEAGERVVSAGGFKLRNNARVRISELSAADAQLEPTPINR